MKTLTTLLIPATLMLGAAISQPVIAQVAPAPASVAVTHADLDLNTAEGRERLERRLQIAAREVCGTGYSFDLESRNAARDCVDATLASIEIPATNQIASAE